ncbi:MAG: SAF domain-containing protein, partial [Candidatus Anammoxibacter sp.]
PDCALSADPKEMKQIVDGIREVEAAMGTGLKIPAKTELKMRNDARKSVISVCDLSAGHILTKDDFIIKRPAWGVEPKNVKRLIGLTLSKEVNKDEPITWDHFVSKTTLARIS